MREVTNQGLLNPQPYTTSGFEMVAPPTSVSTVSIPQNNLDTIAGNTTTVEGNTCSHPPVSSCRVVPAVGNLPEIYVLPVSSRRVVPAVGNLPEIYVLPVSSRRVVPAVGNLPEIYVLPLGKFYTLPFIVCACLIKVDKLLYLLFSNTHIHLYIVMSCIAQSGIQSSHNLLLLCITFIINYII